MSANRMSADEDSGPLPTISAPAVAVIFCDLCHGVQPLAAGSSAQFLAGQLLILAASMLVLLFVW
jgi:hypothetical protein